MFLSSLNIAASGLTAQRYRLDIISQNITNSQTTRVENGEGPYRRKAIAFQSVTSGSTKNTFKDYLMQGASSGSILKHIGTEKNYTSIGAGVRIQQVVEDPSPNKMVYDPTHPDADEDGYVQMPNVELVQEYVDMMSASRSYEANIQVLNAIKAMASKALEIGR